MRAAFASEHPADDVYAFSGIPYHMSQAIGEESTYVELIQTPAYELEAVHGNSQAGRAALQRAGEFLSHRLSELDVDVVVCQGSSMIPFLETEKTVVLRHDSTWFGLMQMDFAEFQAQHPLLYEWDCRLLDRCDAIVFAADWVCEQTLAHYDVEPRKLHVVPWGANVETLEPDLMQEIIAHRSASSWRLTFLGIDWQRKGLPLAYDVMRGLIDRGIDAELNIIGCDVPKIGRMRKLKHYTGYRPLSAVEQFQIRLHKDPSAKKTGFLGKRDSSQYNRLKQILQRSHFLLHPAHFECFGIALAEANAFGVPVLATANHGPRTIIRDGHNGYVFERSTYVAQAVETICNLIERRDSYAELAFSSYLEHRNRLNWTSGFQQIKAILAG